MIFGMIPTTNTGNDKYYQGTQMMYAHVEYVGSIEPQENTFCDLILMLIIAECFFFETLKRVY